MPRRTASWRNSCARAWRYDGWARAALPWTLAGWSFLGLALLLGGYWAYETLGWGGYWGWDPVENSSLVPWITSTALLHGLLVQRSGGGLRRANFALAILTYVLVFYATFLTRTGVLSSFSVHSFVAEGLKWIMTGFLAFLPVGEGLAGLAVDFQCPLQPLGVIGMNAGSGHRIDLCQFLVHGGPAFGGGFFQQLGADVVVGRGQVGNAFP